jgi:hypothetical protein
MRQSPLTAVRVLSAGPIGCSAPEVLCPPSDSVLAATATDVYQFGGVLHELLTCGDVPFWWLLKNMSLLYQRRCSAEPVEIPGTDFTVPGLKNMNTLVAAAVDKKAPTWRVRLGDVPGSGTRLQEVVSIMEGCLEEDPARRLKVDVL